MNETVCPVNLGGRERGKRWMFGVVMTLIGAAAAYGAVASGVPRWWRVGVFIPLWAGALGFFQAMASTCVVLAARGVRHMGTAEEEIPDLPLRDTLRRRARRVHRQSVVTGAILTAGVLVL
jgi:hypothetical protein